MFRFGKAMGWALTGWACLTAGCGARTDPVLDTSAGLQSEADGGGGSGGGPTGGCMRCTVQVSACTYCMLQGSDSYVCALGQPAPSKGCFNLQEIHNENGWKFTCYYCD